MAVQINVAANQAALVASIQAGVQAYNQRFANNNQINLNINARAFSQPLGRITGDVKDFEAALAASNARVIAFGASTAVLGGVIRSFKELASVTIDVEKNLADINRVFGLTTSQLQKFSTELFNVSKLTASSFDDASKAALEFSRQGLKAEETLQRTKDALTLTRLAGISTANAVDALTSTVNGFAATGISTTQILNKLVAVEQDYAVGAGDLAEALSRTGQAAQEAGVSLDQLNALVTAAQQSTARGGAVIGNALKTIFTRLQRTETLDQLEAFNIAVRDVQGNILPAVTILQNFAGAYKNLADAQKAQLSEQVAGVYQVNILKAVVNDLNNAQGVYAGALQRGASATNEAEVATAKLNRTLDALLSQTATSAQQLANNIGKVTFEPLARYGTEQLKSLVENMNEILEGEGIGSTFANGLLKGIRNILAGPGAIAAFFTLFKLIQNSFTYLSQALPQIAGITTETQNRKNIEQSILQIMQQQGPLSQALAGTMGNQAAQAQLLLQLARQQTAEYQQQSALAKQLAVQLSGQGVKVAGARGLQVTRAGGYVPPATRMAEVVGAQAGGYSPGKVVASPVGGVMNTAEDVKYIPGFAQPFINPPANSKAGRAHRQNAISRTGVDPYVANGFIPNFAAAKQFIDDKGEVITGKKPNKTRDSYTVRLTDYDPRNLKADEDLDLKRKLVDSGYWNDSVRDPKTGKILHYHGEPNNIYDTLSGNLKVVKYLNKDEVDKATQIAWDGLISGNTTWMNDPNITNLGMNQSSVEAAFDRTKGKLGLTLEDFRFKKLASENSSVAASNITREKPYKSLKTKTVYKTSQEFKKSLNGDFSNFIGDFYEQLVLKHQNISGRYQISAGNTDPADLVPKILGQTMYKGIEAKNTAARINDLIAKAIRINVDQMNQNTWDKSNDVDFGTFPIYQTKGVTISHNGFIPNFSPLIDDNARNKHDFPGGVPILPIPDKALQNIVDRQKKRQMTYLDFDRTLVRTMGDIAYSRVSPDQKKGVLQKMFLNKEARLNDIKSSKLTQFGELLRKKIQEGVINPSLLGLLTASDETPGMPEYISSIWGIPKRNQIYSAKPGTKEAKLASLGVSASGFIPNFAISMQAARIPWFKKYSSLFKNSAGDKDVFRQKDFPTFGNGLDHRYAKEGNADVIGSLYEKFIRNAMNIARNSNVFKTNKEMGFDEMLTTTGNTAPFDFFENLGSGDFRGIQAKAGSKNNQSSGGGVTQTLTKNIARFAGTNPKDVDRLKEATLVYNDPKYIDPTGKNISARFTPFELSIAALVKDSFANVDPNIKPKLQQLTDSLLNQYNQIKNTANPRINAGGFIPNFLNKKIRSGIIKAGRRPIVYDLTKKDPYYKGDYLWHSDVYNANNPSEQLSHEDFVDMPHLFRGFVNKNGMIEWQYSDQQLEAFKDAKIQAKVKAKLNAVEKQVFADYQKMPNAKINISKYVQFNEQNPLAFEAPSYANGFMPNFAYKQAVMSLEESMSGNKAIFDTKPFPHIRNSSQPTFSSAIADHGSLNNALSDSMRGQKAAGLMSRGFVPNFAKQPNNGSFDIVRFSNSIATSVDNFGKQLSNKIGSVKDSMLLGLEDMNQNFDPQKIQRSAESTAKKIISSISGAGNKFAETVSSSGIDAINNVRNKFTRQNTSQSTGNTSSQRLTAAQMAASFGNMPTSNPMFEKFKENLSKASTAISLAGPMVAGLVEQASFGNKKRTEMSATERGLQSGLSTGLTSISTGAGIGAAFGPIGAGIGAAAGALVGLTSALNATTLSAEELADLNQEQVQKSQASISAASSYIEAQKSLTQMITSGASSSDIEIASKKLSDNFNEIKDIKLQEIFNATGGDVSLMTKQLQEYTNQVTKESARQTGLYGNKLKPEERASALSLGLGKEGSKDFISKIRNGLQNIKSERDALLKSMQTGFGGGPFNLLGFAKLDPKNSAEELAKSIIPENEPERESKIKTLAQNILDKNFEKVLDELEKNIDTIDLSKYIQNNKKVATESMTTIFQRIDESLLKLSFDLSMSFEEMSSQQKIKNIMNDFAFSFEEQITNFVISNLPDYKKFQFAQLSIKQKTQSALQKQQQEQSSLLLNQQKERSDLIQSNAKDLSSIFKQSMATSQENAKFFEQSILGKIKTANYKDIGIESIAQQIKASRVEQFRSILSAQGESLVGQTVLDLTNEADVENFRKNVVEKQKTAIKTAKAQNLPETQIQSIADKFTNILTALNNALSATAFAASKNEKNAVQAALDEKARSIEKLDQQQQNAVKELQILQETNKLKLLAEEKFSTERSKVDQENLMRLKAVDSQIKRMGFAQTISKAESEARVMDIQSTLNDPRNQLFLSLKEINENRIKAEREMIQERRAMEDEAMKNEQAQALLRLSAEIDNTTALENLNNTINDWLISQSTEKIGGQAKLREMLNNPYVGMDANQINDYLQNRAADLGPEYNPSYEQQRIAEAQLYSSDQISALKMYKEASGNKIEIPKYSGMDFSKLEKATANDPVAAEQVKLLKEEYLAKAAAEQRLRAAQDRARQKDEENLRNQTSFSKRFEAGVGALKKESGVIVYDLTEKVPKMFADGLVDGIKAAIRQAENLGDVLMGIAASFLDEISTALMRSAVYGMLGSIGVPNLPKPAGSQRGGIIRAQNGVYVSGSGSGDKYPAMLENGEYVLNRNAVMAMGGPSELDKLNFSMAPRFATGGTFATELTDLKSMEEGMTTFGLENSKLYNELRDEEKAKQAEKRRKAFARKQMIAGLIASVASIVVSAGAMKIASGTGMGGEAVSKGPGLDKPEGLGYGISSSRDTSLAIGTGGQTGGSFTGKNFRKSNNSLSYGSRLSDTIPAYAEGGLHSLPIIRKYSTGMQGGGMYGGVSNNSNTVNNNNASNSFNFNTTVNRDGTIEMGANTTSYKQQDVELSNNLNSKIYGTVLDVIKQQQRFGGTLAGTRRPI